MLPGGIGSSNRLGSGIPRSSSAGGGVWGVDPKDGGGVSSREDLSGLDGLPDIISVESNPGLFSMDIFPGGVL